MYIDFIVHEILNLSSFVENPLAAVLARPVDEYKNDSPMSVEDSRYATARCRQETVADNLVEATRSR